MNIPLFLDVEYCHTDSHFFPTGVAWSLPDGRIKTTLIIPDDDWLPQLAEDPDLDLQLLYQQGAPAMEVVREMNEDLDDQEVYCDALELKEALVEVLFSAVHDQPAFQLASMQSLIPNLQPHELEDRGRVLMNEHELQPGLAESGVFVLLQITREAGLIEE